MENIRKHLQESFDSADNAYWELVSNLETKRIKLATLSNEINYLETDMLKLNKDRNYYQKLLNELNEK